MTTSISTATATVVSTPWTDGKRNLWLLSPFIPCLVLIVMGLAQYTGWWSLTWFAPALLYVLIPLAD
ncbi:MAG: alkane 1-monooxygenase, partial [Stenotrophobium sp.]